MSEEESTYVHILKLQLYHGKGVKDIKMKVKAMLCKENMVVSVYSILQ